MLKKKEAMMASSPGKRSVTPAEPTITKDSFRVPPLAITDPALIPVLEPFSGRQADMADEGLGLLHGFREGGLDGASAYERYYGELLEWRVNLADEMASSEPNPQVRERRTSKFRRVMIDGDTEIDGPNHDPVGRLSWLTPKGWPTPALAVSMGIYEIARARFANEAGIDSPRRNWIAHPSGLLQNWITYPNGERVAGNQLLTGKAHQEGLDNLEIRYQARGSLDRTTDEVIDVRCGTAANRARHRDQAFKILGELDGQRERTGGCVPMSDENKDKFNLAVYLLLQGQERKGGSDAVTRTLRVTAGADLFGIALDTDPALDLRGLVEAQEDFIRGQRAWTRPARAARPAGAREGRKLSPRPTARRRRHLAAAIVALPNTAPSFATQYGAEPSVGSSLKVNQHRLTPVRDQKAAAATTTTAMGRTLLRSDPRAPRIRG